MNISTSAVVEARKRDGEAADERPAYVDEALQQSRKVGYQSGLPLVEPEGDHETPQLGESVNDLYEHYVSGSDLFRPDAGSFLKRLAEQPEIHNVEAASSELGPSTDKAEVRKAAQLHGLDIPDGEGVDESSDEDAIRLPSGESVPLAILEGPTDKLVLAQLFSDGLSEEEIARYLSEETDSNVTVREVREAATEANLLGGGGDSLRGPAPRPSDVHVGSGSYDKEPW